MGVIKKKTGGGSTSGGGTSGGGTNNSGGGTPTPTPSAVATLIINDFQNPLSLTGKKRLVRPNLRQDWVSDSTGLFFKLPGGAWEKHNPAASVLDTFVAACVDTSIVGKQALVTMLYTALEHSCDQFLTVACPVGTNLRHVFTNTLRNMANHYNSLCPVGSSLGVVVPQSSYDNSQAQVTSWFDPYGDVAPLHMGYGLFAIAEGFESNTMDFLKVAGAPAQEATVNNFFPFVESSLIAMYQ